MRHLLVILIAFVSLGGMMARSQEPETNPAVAILVEVVSLEKTEGSQLLASKTVESSTRGTIDRLVTEGRGRLHDCLYLRLDHDSKADLKSVEEIIFGTEGDPPEIPNEVVLKGDLKGKISPTNSTYAAFDVRDAGNTWRVKARVKTEGAGKKNPALPTIRLEGELEWVTLLFRELPVSGPNVPKDNPMAAKWQPRFHSAEILNPLRLVDGKSALVGTLEEAGEPDRLLFVFLTAWILK